MNSHTPADNAPVILHLGLGSFHRAHQAVYLDQLREREGCAWSIVASNVRDDNPGLIETLACQDGHYTLETVSPQGERTYRLIRSIARVIPYDAELRSLVKVGADHSTRIISFTVTEAGYCLDPQDSLDMHNSDLRSDIERDTHLTIYGVITCILQARADRGGGPVTLLNCDNLRGNGSRFRDALLEFLGRTDRRELVDWVESHVLCPNSMVDRITPRPDAGVARRVLSATGWADRAPVMSESFTQWVIEDRFAAGRPEWERVGVQLTDDVGAHEEAKLRILNAAHSCIAWAGAVRGIDTIHEALAQPDIALMAREYVMKGAIPCLSAIGVGSRIDVQTYGEVVLERFRNVALHDTVQRVASDSVAKLQRFVIPTLRDCLTHGLPLDSVALLPSLLFDFLGHWHRGLIRFTHVDAAMDAPAMHALLERPDPLKAFCADAALWGDLAGHAGLTEAIAHTYSRVQQDSAYTGRKY